MIPTMLVTTFCHGCDIVSLPILFCWLPRSPRYLIATGKVPRASRILEFFSRVSGKALPEGKLVPTRDSDLGGEEDDAALGVFDQLKGYGGICVLL